MVQFLLGFWHYVVVFLIILTVVVFVHEMGHFVIARLNGVKIETFSIGFGPEIWGRTAKSGTRWRVSLLPLGGYVKMFGDADPASTPDPNAVRFTAEEKAQALQFKKVWQRAAIVAAGPLANFAFAIIALAVMVMVYGETRTAPLVGEVQPDSAAAAAGMRTGDRVLTANGEQVERFQDLQRIVRMTVGEPVDMMVQRDGATLRMVVQPRVVEQKDPLGNLHKMPLLGITANPDATEVIHHSPPGAILEAGREITEMVSASLTGLGQMLTGRRPTDELGGPLRIAKGAGQAAQLGVASVVFYTILISVNLGLINLFPVPLLDGGHLLFYGIEAVLGRPLGPRAQEYGFRIGLFLVFALMLIATRNDLVDLGVFRFIKGIVS